MERGVLRTLCKALPVEVPREVQVGKGRDQILSGEHQVRGAAAARRSRAHVGDGGGFVKKGRC